MAAPIIRKSRQTYQCSMCRKNISAHVKYVYHNQWRPGIPADRKVQRYHEACFDHLTSLRRARADMAWRKRHTRKGHDVHYPADTTEQFDDYLQVQGVVSNMISGYHLWFHEIARRALFSKNYEEMEKKNEFDLVSLLAPSKHVVAPGA